MTLILSPCAPRIGQQPVSEREPLRQNIFGEARALRLEQPLHEARRKPMASGERGQRKIGSEILGDVVLDHFKPRRAQAAALSHFGGVTRGSKHDRQKVVQVIDHDMLQFTAGRRLLLPRLSDIVRQETKRRNVARYSPHAAVTQAVDERSEPRTGEAQGSTSPAVS